ncbi:MAG: hypothetical protein RL757_1651 [Bacteroidota bacterium]|jgi:glutamyl-tRNA synthetase
MSIRVRFAPSPTGALHIGGIRTALYNYLLAKKMGGTFILRIEDTDQSRFVEGAEQYIIDALRWCGIAPTEGIGFGDGAHAPYRQSERKSLYLKFAHELVEKGLAYFAFDTPAELETMREKLKSESHQSYSMHTRNAMRNSLTLPKNEVEALIAAGTPHVIRMKIVDNEVITINDLIRGEVNVNTTELDDKVLLKADGMPTYHLANIVDDFDMKITHVIRGEEWLPSVAHHVLLYRYLGFDHAMPQFAHLPLILKPDGNGKLSKRDGKKFGFPVFPLAWAGATDEESFDGFREIGFDPRALVNFMSLIGWSSGSDQEIFSLEEMTELFSLEKIQKAGARFDYKKALWFNQQYILKSSNAELAAQLVSKVAEKGYKATPQYIADFAGLMKERVQFLNDFLEKGYYFFEDVKDFDVENVKKRWKPENRAKFDELIAVFKKLDFDSAAAMEADVKHWIAENALKMGEILPILRIALMGTMQGPGVFETAQLLGKVESVGRLKTAFTKFDTF